MVSGVSIVGIGATDFSKNSGRSELQLAVEAITDCLRDAGASPEDVDGLSTFTMNETSELDIRREIGMPDLRFFTRVPFGGGGGCGTIAMAAMAIKSGIAKSVVAYRSLNTASKIRFGSGDLVPPPESGDQRLFVNVGLMTPASRVGMTAQYYLHKFGLPDTAYAPFALTAREYAATNPAAFYYKRPLSLEEYLDAPWISHPLRRFDCCQESDGAVAILITSDERAKDFCGVPIKVAACAQSCGFDQIGLAQYWSEDMLELPEIPGLVRQLQEQSGIEVNTVDAAMLYDHFTPLVALQLEQFGFCEPGEATGFAADGQLRLGGALPLNTHGGHLGEAYLHGMSHICEAVRQLRGEAINQILEVETLLVASAAATPNSALILTRH